MEFIEVMRRNDTREMLTYMDKIYESRIGIPGWTTDESVLSSKKDMIMATHDMIRLALSISQPAKDLLKEISELKKEIEKLRSDKHSEQHSGCPMCGRSQEYVMSQFGSRIPKQCCIQEQSPKNPVYEHDMVNIYKDVLDSPYICINCGKDNTFAWHEQQTQNSDDK